MIANSKSWRSSVILARGKHDKDSHLNNLTSRGRFLRLKGIIPLTMESISDEMQRRQLLVGHLDASRIGTTILHGSDRQPLIGGGVGDQFNDRFQPGQRLGAPIDGDVGKESVFDLVPLAGAWGKMADGDGESGF